MKKLNCVYVHQAIKFGGKLQKNSEKKSYYNIIPISTMNILVNFLPLLLSILFLNLKCFCSHIVCTYCLYPYAFK